MIEIVRGTIIGARLYRYEFWSGERLICREFLANDDEAEQWFRENHPREYDEGVEMRRYDD